MKHCIAAATVAATMAFGAERADALSLGLDTLAPTLSSSTAVVDYVEFAPDGDLSTFGAEVDFTDGVSPNGFTEIGFGVGFSLSDPTTGLTGGFDVFDEDGLFLGGDLFAVGFAEDVIELQFTNLAGSAVGSFEASVLAVLAFDDPLGVNPFASLLDGDSLGATITISNVAPIPLPASLPLLLAGLGGFALLRVRRRA